MAHKSSLTMYWIISIICTYIQMHNIYTIIQIHTYRHTYKYSCVYINICIYICTYVLTFLPFDWKIRIKNHLYTYILYIHTNIQWEAATSIEVARTKSVMRPQASSTHMYALHLHPARRTCKLESSHDRTWQQNSKWHALLLKDGPTLLPPKVCSQGKEAVHALWFELHTRVQKSPHVET